MDAMRNGHPVIAPDKADFDFEKTEMKYDSTGMFHWTPSRSLEECILVSRVLIPSYSRRFCSFYFAGP